MFPLMEEKKNITLKKGEALISEDYFPVYFL